MTTKAEEILRRAIAEGKDPFTQLASELYVQRYELVNKIQREMAKSQAYGLIYAGQSGPEDLKKLFRG